MHIQELQTQPATTDSQHVLYIWEIDPLIDICDCVAMSCIIMHFILTPKLCLNSNNMSEF